MTFFWVLSYFVIGMVLSRFVFVSMLGDSPRLSSYGYWSDAMTGAFWLGVLTVFFWPVTGLFRLMISPTPHEKNEAKKIREAAELKARKKQLAELEARAQKLADQYGLDSLTVDYLRLMSDGKSK